MIAFAFGAISGLVAGFAWGLYKHSLGYNEGFDAARKFYVE